MLKHLLSRHYDPARYPTQWITDSTLSIPLHDFSGALRGIQIYTPDNPKKHPNPKCCRYFSRSFSKQVVWGRELPVKTGVIFLTESVFKSAALHELGVDSWSINGSNIEKTLLHQLRVLPYQFIPIGDEDKAGRAFSRYFSVGGCLDDLDERTPEELKGFLNSLLDLTVENWRV